MDIVQAGFDAGVRWDESLAQDMIAISLGAPQRYAVVAAPEVIARHGAPSAPRDLLVRPCVRIRFPSGVMPAWEFERDGGIIRIEPEARLVTNSIPLLLRAALDGVGFCTAFEGQVREHVAAGRLISVMEDWLPPFPAPFLYYPNRDVPSALRAFIDFVKRNAG